MAVTGQHAEQDAPEVVRLLEDLRQKSGLKRDVLLARKIAGVLRQHPLGDQASWIDDLVARPPDDPVWLAFVEAVTVHETYFFRDPAQLAVLSEHILPALLETRAAAGRRFLRLWSAGCASGEEAYSAAILVLEAISARGEKPGDWSITVLGSDISRAVLDRARAGIYGGPGLNAFRRLPSRHARHFSDHTGGRAGLRRIDPLLSEMATFCRHNLMDDEPPQTGFDIALCRNVFIYFDDAAQRRAVATLHRGLIEGGVLLLGVTDRLAADSGFVRETRGTAAIYRRGA